MIAECITDLLAKIRTVGALATATALTIGGRSTDPGLVKVPLPAAWVTFARDMSDEPSYDHGPRSGMVHQAPVVIGTFAITLFVPYTTDADMLAIEYPLLEAVVAAIHATDAPSGFRWRYAGQRLALIYPDRIVYEQRYTLDYTLA
ncbi:MAG: hypothetical protein KGL43_18910 [Burkholderiales bacterium]|nr:hypothetical protein [Burkholderiales bacterium]